jgi:ferrous iron transport protein A
MAAPGVQLPGAEVGVFGFGGVRRRRLGASAAPRGGDGDGGSGTTAEASAEDHGQDRLSALAPGSRGTVVAVGGGPQVRARLVSLGFVPGTAVTMVQNRGQGPLIVELRATQIALGRREADKVRLAAKEPTSRRGDDEPR